MRMGFERLGRRGLALLAVTGASRPDPGSPRLVGPRSGASAGTAGRQPGPASPRASAASPRASAAPRPSGSPGRSPSGSHGPLLSSRTLRKLGLSGLAAYPEHRCPAGTDRSEISVRRQGSGLSVTAGILGQPPSAPHLYPHGARVYVVETSLGDDSGNTDYSLGDDGLVVTSAQGTVIQ